MPGVTVKFYNNIADKRQLSKVITQIGSDLTCQITDNCTVTDPVLLVDLNELYIGANYCYIAKFNRYYFINNIDVINGNQMSISCHVDVLMSHASAIRNASVVANRSSSNYDKYQQDSAIPFTERNIQYIRKLSGNPFPGVESGALNYVLILGGK